MNSVSFQVFRSNKTKVIKSDKGNFRLTITERQLHHGGIDYIYLILDKNDRLIVMDFGTNNKTELLTEYMNQMDISFFWIG